MVRELTLLFHFVGFGLLFTAAAAGYILDRQYRKAGDLASKAAILRASKPIGLIGPFAIILQTVTGIGNIHALGLSVADTWWLLAKIVVFIIASGFGLYFGMVARKRGALVGQMAAGKAPEGADTTLKGYDTLLGFFHLIMPVFLLIIVCLSIYGRLGGQ